jgi:hypothetical protein
MSQALALLDAVQALYVHYEQLLKMLGAVGIPAGLYWLIKEYRARVRIEISDLAFPVLSPDVVRSVTFSPCSAISPELQTFRVSDGGCS